MLPSREAHTFAEADLPLEHDDFTLLIAHASIHPHFGQIARDAVRINSAEGMHS